MRLPPRGGQHAKNKPQMAVKRPTGRSGTPLDRITAHAGARQVMANIVAAHAHASEPASAGPAPHAPTRRPRISNEPEDRFGPRGMLKEVLPAANAINACVPERSRKGADGRAGARSYRNWPRSLTPFRGPRTHRPENRGRRGRRGGRGAAGAATQALNWMVLPGPAQASTCTCIARPSPRRRRRAPPTPRSTMALVFRCGGATPHPPESGPQAPQQRSRGRHTFSTPQDGCGELTPTSNSKD